MSSRTIYRKLIAATPGWFVVRYFDECTYDEVIAWEIKCVETVDTKNRSRILHLVTPITFEGEAGVLGEDWALKTPAGKFEIVDDRTLESEEEYVELMKAWAAAKS